MKTKHAYGLVTLALIVLSVQLRVGAIQNSQAIYSHGTIFLSTSPSYTIYSIAGTYYAEDSDGNLDSTSTDASTVIQYAIDHTDDLIYVEDGRYPIDTSIIPDSKTHIKGQSWNTIFESDHLHSVFSHTNDDRSGEYLDDCIFEDFSIDGNKVGAGGWACGLRLWSFRNLVIRNLHIYDVEACGLMLKGYSKYTGRSSDLLVQDCKLERCGGPNTSYGSHAIYIADDIDKVTVERVILDNNHGCAFQFRAGGGWMRNVTVRKAEVYHSTGEAVQVLSGIDGITFEDCKFNNNAQYGLRVGIWNPSLSNTYNIKITNCEAIGNGVHGIYFSVGAGECRYIEISHNNLRNRGSSYDINLDSYCDNFKIVYNQIRSGSLNYPTAGKTYEVHDNG